MRSPFRAFLARVIVSPWRGRHVELCFGPPSHSHKLARAVVDVYFYELLGVAPGATDDEIKKAYRRMALAWHPVRTRSLLAREGLPPSRDLGRRQHKQSRLCLRAYPTRVVCLCVRASPLAARVCAPFARDPTYAHSSPARPTPSPP